MTDQEINVTIAEFCGRELYKPTEEEIRRGSYYQYEPNYCTDLNTIHEAESKLSGEQIWTYLDELPQSCSEWFSVHATARQRAEALLRTIGKWKD